MTYQRVVIVAPTAHLARHWAATAHRIGLNITPAWEGQREPRDMHGIAITQASHPGRGRAAGGRTGGADCRGRGAGYNPRRTLA